MDALAAELAGAVDGVILVPAFFDAGRYTIDNVHFVDTGRELVPASDTEFAKDPDFGFTHADLREWVQEKTSGRVRADQVIPLSIEDIRRGGPEKVAEKLAAARNGIPIIANAACDEDLEVLALGAQAAEGRGRSFLYRTSASFVKVRAGISDRPLLSRSEMEPGPGPGLVIAGSYVSRTSEQIRRLLEPGRVVPVEFSVPLLLHGSTRAEEIRRAAHTASEALARGTTVLVFTTREKHSSSDFLAAGRIVMDGLCDVVRGIRQKPGLPGGQGRNHEHRDCADGAGLLRGARARAGPQGSSRVAPRGRIDVGRYSLRRVPRKCRRPDRAPSRRGSAHGVRDQSLSACRRLGGIANWKRAPLASISAAASPTETP